MFDWVIEIFDTTSSTRCALVECGRRDFPANRLTNSVCDSETLSTASHKKGAADAAPGKPKLE
jgi:hypothetical protein